jgi:hypothetical protein
MLVSREKSAMNKVRILILFGFWMMLASWGISQTRFQTGINFNTGLPQNEFRDNIETVGLGANGYFAHRISESPVSVGFSFSYLNYGRTTRTEPISLTIPGLWVDVVTTNNIYLGHGFLRLQPPRGSLRPYLDGYLGFHGLSTNTSIRSQDYYSESIASTNISRDFTFSYGAGGGLMIRVHESRQEDFAVDIELAARYLKGGEAYYLREDSTWLAHTGYAYDFYRSDTDLISAHFGVCFSF